MKVVKDIPDEAIRCSACVEKKPNEGCIKCGGYGFLAYPQFCDGCGQKYWLRPGVFTCYDGKKITTFDGLELTYHFIDGVVSRTCSRCPEEPSPKESA